MRALSGPLLVAIGVLDVLYVLISHFRQLAGIAGDGFFGAVELAPAALDREVAFWHLTFGVTVVILGALIHWAQARTGTLPAFLGWALLALGLSGAVLVPVSGFWVILPLAVLMLVAARQGRYGATTANEAAGKPTTGAGRQMR